MLFLCLISVVFGKKVIKNVKIKKYFDFMLDICDLIIYFVFCWLREL